MSERRKLFYKTLGRWWQMAAMEGYDWSQPDTSEMCEAEDSLWESKELFENGDIKLSEVRPVFDTWVKTHRKLEAATSELTNAMRTARRREAHA